MPAPPDTAFLERQAGQTFLSGAREQFFNWLAALLERRLVELAERQKWKPRLRQTARQLGVVQIDDQTIHEPVLHVEVGRNAS